MSRTFHHDQKRFRPTPRDARYDFWMGHAPGWFKHLLTRLYRRKADREVVRYGEVVTKKPRGADWEWW